LTFSKAIRPLSRRPLSRFERAKRAPGIAIAAIYLFRFLRFPWNRGNFSRFRIPSIACESRSARYLLFSAALLVIVLAGCGKKPPSSTEIHGISQELAAAAQEVAGRQSQITIRPEAQPARNGKRGTSADVISVTLDDPHRESALVKAIVGVARRHELTRGPLATNTDVVQFDLFWRSQRTHTIRITESTASSVPASAALPPNAARLAIIIDDFGEDAAPAREFLKLPCPLTLSIIPNLQHSTDIADEAYKRGDEILLHFPMEASEGNAESEAVELRVGMKSDQVDDMLSSMLASVPHAAGVNNHQGSRATADSALMDALMPALRRRGLFFVDSRTTVDTVAYTAAEHDGVPATFRSAEFLDDVETRSAVLRQLDRAASEAKHKGWAVTIGHPHPATLAALREALPRLASRGVYLVFVSDVLK